VFDLPASHDVIQPINAKPTRFAASSRTMRCHPASAGAAPAFLALLASSVGYGQLHEGGLSRLRRPAGLGLAPLLGAALAPPRATCDLHPPARLCIPLCMPACLM
jgi:hypothetical protein